MFNSRPKKLSANSSHLAYQQRRLHHSQKKAGLHDKISLFTLRLGQYDASHILFWVLLLNAANAALGDRAPNPNEKSDEEVTALAHRAMRYCNTLTQAEKESRVCQGIANRAGVIAGKNDLFRENALVVLKQKNFKLVCTNKKFISSIYSAGSALFSAKLNRIYIAYEDFRDFIFNHEMIHARLHAEHTNASQCYIPVDHATDVSTVPFHPVNDVNVERFLTAMEAGMSFIKHLYWLQGQAFKGENLTAEQMLLLTSARAALKGTLNCHVRSSMSLEFFNQMKRDGWPKVNPLKTTLFEYPILINRAEVTGNGVIVDYESLHPIGSAFMSVLQYEDMKEHYKKRNPQILYSECLAHNLQVLDTHGRQYLFPGLTEFLKEQQDYCRAGKTNELIR